jgi:hypothetical protein
MVLPLQLRAQGQAKIVKRGAANVTLAVPARQVVRQWRGRLRTMAARPGIRHCSALSNGGAQQPPNCR